MTYVPDSLRVLSLNVGGLNVPAKRHIALREFRTQKVSVALLQETHLTGPRAPSLRNRDYPTGFYSKYTLGKMRGTAILLARSLPFTLRDSKCDTDGRYTLVKGTIGDQLYTFASVYLPNKRQHRASRGILRVVGAFAEGILIVGGDINMVLDPKMDTSRGNSSLAQSVLRQTRLLLHEHRLVDSWRAQHPTGRDYTYYSALHRRYTRLDYIFIPFQHAHLIRNSTIGTTTWTDHSPVIVTLATALYRSKSLHWRLNETLLADAEVLKGLTDTLEHYFEDNVRPDTPSPLVWEAHKAVARGYLITQGARLKRARTSQFEELHARITTLEQTHKAHLLDATYTELMKLKAELHTLLNISALQKIRRTKQLYFEHGNKCGRLLAHSLSRQRNASYISKIRAGAQAPSSLPQDIMTLFHKHFQDTYNLPKQTVTQNADTIEAYLRQHLRITLSCDARQSLDRPITGEELEEAIKLTPSGKSPGPDGLSLQYYKSLHGLLAQHWLRAFNSLTEGTHLQASALTANITLIPKPGKDPELCSSYRPISLLNQDLKLFAKVLANRLKAHVPTLVHSDQTGFIPGREGRANTVRAIDLIHAATTGDREPTILLSTDADKAFDRVGWLFLSHTLRFMGVGTNMLTWINALYTNPTARVNINGALSVPFPITNGTRQGCPLSPLLFALTLEPFLQAVHSDIDLHGVEVGNREHRVAAYADDMLFFLRQPRISLPKLLHLFVQYGALSNLKINMDKSEILPLHVPPDMKESLVTAFPFRWCSTGLKYLGIILTPENKNNVGDIRR
uniref:Reverse transcriptase domain-containing protein n=1 Tax=Leptobrachium leishanense TaxID=445787 RepID=A0A8C5P9T9_9ANUR